MKWAYLLLVLVAVVLANYVVLPIVAQARAPTLDRVEARIEDTEIDPVAGPVLVLKVSVEGRGSGTVRIRVIVNGKEAAVSESDVDGYFAFSKTFKIPFQDTRVPGISVFVEAVGKALHVEAVGQVKRVSPG